MASIPVIKVQPREQTFPQHERSLGKNATESPKQAIEPEFIRDQF